MGTVLECGNLDIKQFNEDIIAYSGSAWIPADVDEKVYAYKPIDSSGEESIRYKFFTVIKFSSPCFATICEKDLPTQAQWAVSVPQDSMKKNTDQITDFMLDTEGHNIQTNEALIAFGSSQDDEEYSPPEWPPLRSIPETIPSTSDLTKQSMAGIDSNSINDLGFQPVAVRPLGAVVPLRYNVETYGPWMSTNFYTSGGGIDVSVNQDLAPWIFGSRNIMNQVGYQLVEFNQRGLGKAESGSVTVLGIPSSSHNLPRLGYNLNNAGPNLTNISFSLNSKGATTTYEFKTYTPKFGKLNKLFVERIKNLQAQKTRQLRFLRDLQSKQNKLQRKIAARAAWEKANPVKSDASSNSMQRVIVATMNDWYNLNNYNSQKTTAGFTTLAKTSIETAYKQNYASKAIMSVDGLFSPVSKKGDAQLPKFVDIDPSSNASGPEPSLPPTLDDNISSRRIDNTTYEPLIDGHSIDMVAKGTEVSDNGLINSFYAAWDNSKYSNDYRFIGMRGPIILHSWGYDTDGNPVPSNGTDFIDGYLQRPREWPVAPIDLRLDKKRGVWVSPQPYKIIKAKMTSPLFPYDEGTAIVFGEKDEINGKTIAIQDKIGQGLPNGCRIYAYYDTFLEKYIVLEAYNPGVMTGTADATFTPASATANVTIQFGPLFFESISAKNDMGYGADAGHFVTVQSYIDADKIDYQYIVIGTGKPKQEY